MIVASNFTPAPWLKNPHLQTIYAGLWRRLPSLAFREERLELPDGDFVDLAWSIGSQGPIVVLLHGLTGSVHTSRYIRGLMNAIHDRGWRAVLMHFRGASGVPNRIPRSYHAGDTSNLNFLIQTLRQREPTTPIAAVGYSLGGNVLLKWMAEQGASAPVETAVAVSVPFDLAAAAERVQAGFSKVYQNRLLNNMKRMTATKFADMPAPFELPDLNSITNFIDFDDQVTAPLCGFGNANEYYQRSSCGQFIGQIEKTTRIIHARDDPFMTPECVPDFTAVANSVTLELSEHGGHVGFVSSDGGSLPSYWLEQRIPDYLAPFIS